MPEINTEIAADGLNIGQATPETQVQEAPVKKNADKGGKECKKTKRRI